MSTTKVPASVALVSFAGRSVSMDAFASTKELVQHFLSATALAGFWASDEHLAALEETSALLANTIAGVRRDRERGDS